MVRCSIWPLLALFLFPNLALAAQPEPEDPLVILRQNYIGTSSSDLLNFLNHGWAKDFQLSFLPENPPLKTQLALSAIEELGKRREPHAATILLQIAREEFPPFLNRLIEFDLRELPGQRKELRERQLHYLLVHNSLIALGLLPCQDAKPLVQTQFDQASDPAIKTNFALTLATLGDASGIPFLLATTRAENRFFAARALQALYYITGVRIYVNDETPVKLRFKAAELMEKWWELNKEAPPLNSDEIIQRRLDPPLWSERPRQLNQLRDYLYAASFVVDPDNRHQSFEARQWLTAHQQEHLAELKAISLNEEENLRIRAEAIKRYAELEGKKARGELKRLRKDPNTDIAELARNLLDSLKR